MKRRDFLKTASAAGTAAAEAQRSAGPPVSGVSPLKKSAASGAPPMPVWRASGLFFGGLALTLLGAVMLVSGATGIARSFGVSEAVIGLTLVALGTSLPELVTSVLAARRGHGDVALGNILGSNIFNVLGILGATALAKPLPVAPMIAQVDVYVMLAASLALLATGLLWQRISRAAGLALLLGYAVYIGWLSRTLL